jgi:hypothetical protein
MYLSFPSKKPLKDSQALFFYHPMAKFHQKEKHQLVTFLKILFIRICHEKWMDEMHKVLPIIY